MGGRRCRQPLRRGASLSCGSCLIKAPMSRHGITLARRRYCEPPRTGQLWPLHCHFSFEQSPTFSSRAGKPALLYPARIEDAFADDGSERDALCDDVFGPVLSDIRPNPFTTGRHQGSRGVCKPAARLLGQLVICALFPEFLGSYPTYRDLRAPGFSECRAQCKEVDHTGEEYPGRWHY